jgi:hypothetical protein
MENQDKTNKQNKPENSNARAPQGDVRRQDKRPDTAVEPDNQPAVDGNNQVEDGNNHPKQPRINPGGLRNRG